VVQKGRGRGKRSVWRKAGIKWIYEMGEKVGCDSTTQISAVTGNLVLYREE
jgi:hypothetical protein